jgi:hypothetical protein
VRAEKACQFYPVVVGGRPLRETCVCCDASDWRRLPEQAYGLLSGRQLVRAMVLLILLGVFLSVIMNSVAVAQTPAIWFVPRSGNAPAEDFSSLFRPNAPWGQAASHIAVFGMGLPGRRTPQTDFDLAGAFADLRRRNIGLSVDMLPLSGPDSPSQERKCGYHVEGYSAPGQTLSTAQWIKSLGGEPRFFEMDEPLYYGHVYNGPNACHSTVEEIVREVAVKVAQVRSIFPNVRVGDGEPIMGFAKDTWLQDLDAFFSEYQTATGQALAFFRLDIDWNQGWRGRIPPLMQLLKRHGIPLQVIYNGSGQDGSGKQWIDEAMKHAAEFESVAKPDVAAIQCWTQHPRYILPESDPDSLSNMVNRYYAQRMSSH